MKIDRSQVPYPDTWSPQLRAELDTMFEKAIKEGKWFYAQNLLGTYWFSPEQLHDEQMTLQFIWSAENWQLKDPDEYEESLMKEIDNKFEELMLLQRRLEGVWRSLRRRTRDLRA